MRSLHRQTQNARRKLERLRRAGYVFVHTEDDGETWTGTNERGLQIEFLLKSGMFRGQVAVPSPHSAVHGGDQT
jgi:hypothetical protein